MIDSLFPHQVHVPFLDLNTLWRCRCRPCDSNDYTQVFIKWLRGTFSFSLFYQPLLKKAVRRQRLQTSVNISASLFHKRVTESSRWGYVSICDIIYVIYVIAPEHTQSVLWWSQGCRSDVRTGLFLPVCSSYHTTINHNFVEAHYNIQKVLQRDTFTVLTFLVCLSYTANSAHHCLLNSYISKS